MKRAGGSASVAIRLELEGGGSLGQGWDWKLCPWQDITEGLPEADEDRGSQPCGTASAEEGRSERQKERIVSGEARKLKEEEEGVATERSSSGKPGDIGL